MAGMHETPTMAAAQAGDPLCQSGRPVLSDPNGDFARHYNRQSFCFEHGLKGNPLFELDSLVALSQRLPAHPDFAYWSNGPVSVNDPWEKGMAARHSLQDTIAGIAGNNSIVILKHTEQDPVIGPVLREILSKFVEYAGAQMRDDVIVGESLILVSSPKRITPYHFDAELNYLVQVTGDKTFSVFDHTRALQVTDEELEGYFSGAPSAAKYRDANQANATVYDLKAGQGIHIPVTAPHWVQNGDNISVALSINYELKSVARRAKSYWLNHRLRKLGMTPASPGTSNFRDSLKTASATSLQGLRSLVRAAPPAPTWQVWTPR
ncbi:cupin-like domain-containing protein [Nevskia sp.]|uniref:cupin-like domain-containing protein n=1 Tax=Nevskia sp. TaxID=1929292 RepID=UPI0025FB9A01|nr:cupin-like domain-containing protein [Nevskia sp.]